MARRKTAHGSGLGSDRWVAERSAAHRNRLAAAAAGTFDRDGGSIASVPATAVPFDYPEIGDTFADDLALVYLLDDPFDVVVPCGHGLERRQTIRFADLGKENWLLGDFGADSPSFRMIDGRCQDAGFDPNVAYRINDCQMAQALVAAGEGIALLPRIMLQAKHPGVAIRPLATDPPLRRVSTVRLSTRYLTPATERFIALLVAASADHVDTHPNRS